MVKLLLERVDITLDLGKDYHIPLTFVAFSDDKGVTKLLLGQEKSIRTYQVSTVEHYSLSLPTTGMGGVVNFPLQRKHGVVVSLVRPSLVFVMFFLFSFLYFARAFWPSGGPTRV